MTVYDVSVSEAAVRLGVNEETVRRWIRAGTIEARRTVGNRLMLNADDLERLPVRRVVENPGA